MNRLFITGGSGLLALNWAVQMRELYQVTLGLHKTPISLPGVSTKFVELSSREALTRFLVDLSPDLVVHTAGMTNVEACELDSELAFQTNVVLAENIAACCAKLDIRFVHISTDHLFDGSSQMVTEEENVSTCNVYASTKAEAETRVRIQFPESLILRTNFYGWGPSYRQSFSDYIINALHEEAELTLFNDVYYTPILIETLVSIAHELVESGETGVFHISGGERLSKYEFGKKLAKRFNLDSGLLIPSSIKERTELTKRPLDMSLSNHKVCQRLGRAVPSLDEQLSRLLQQQSNQSFKQVQDL